MAEAVAIRPVPVTDAVLTGTDATESVAPWAGGTLYTAGQEARNDTTHRVYESAIGASLGAATISIATPGVVSRTAHGLAADTKVAFTTTGALPTGLAVNTIYYVCNPAANTFELSATAGGASIATSGGQSGVHTLHANPNIGYDPTNPDNLFSDANTGGAWIDARPTNPWAMFDALNGTKTRRADSLTVELTPGKRVDAIGLRGLRGATVRVRVSDGVIDRYDTGDVSLRSAQGIRGWWSWLFEERPQRTTLPLSDLPALAAPVITIDLNGPGADVEIGTAAIGRKLPLGTPEKGLALDFKDFSYWNENPFGVDEVVQRGFKRKLDTRLLLANSRISHVNDELLKLRATPLFWIVTDQFSAGSEFGFFKRLSTVVEYPDHSLVSLSILGTVEDNQ